MKIRNVLPMLFITMMKIGLFTFGGGYAMIALLESECIEKKKWLDKEEFLDLVAIAESTPGPIAINAATYIGYKVAGAVGAVASTAAMCIPSFLIIYTVSLFFNTVLDFRLVEYAFKGIQICVLYLILSAGIKMLKGIKKTAFNIAVFLGVFVVMIVLSLLDVKFSALYYILICGFIGVASYFLLKLREKREGEK